MFFVGCRSFQTFSLIGGVRVQMVAIIIKMLAICCSSLGQGSRSLCNPLWLSESFVGLQLTRNLIVGTSVA